MTNIIESIGSWGVKTTPHALSYLRFKTPKPGDVVDFSECQDTYYAFEDRQYGRIERTYENDCYGNLNGKISICVSASCFLYENGHVSISGGPFLNIDPQFFIPTYDLKVVRFWNFGDRGVGGGNGVDYYIERPIFKLAKGWNDERQTKS